MCCVGGWVESGGGLESGALSEAGWFGVKIGGPSTYERVQRVSHCTLRCARTLACRECPSKHMRSGCPTASCATRTHEHTCARVGGVPAGAAHGQATVPDRGHHTCAGTRRAQAHPA